MVLAPKGYRQTLETGLRSCLACAQTYVLRSAEDDLMTSLPVLPKR